MPPSVARAEFCLRRFGPQPAPARCRASLLNPLILLALSLIVFAGFYPPARRAIQYADGLAEAPCRYWFCP